MLDHAGLHGDAAMVSKEPVAAKRDAASPERRVSIPRGPPPAGRIQAAMTGCPGRTQHLVDETLAAPAVADTSRPDLEIFIAAVHRCGPARVFLGSVLE